LNFQGKKTFLAMKGFPSPDPFFSKGTLGKTRLANTSTNHLRKFYHLFSTLTDFTKIRKTALISYLA